MWLALSGVLLLVVFGSKALSLLFRGVLVAIHKAGLLSNIRIDASTTLQVTVRAVHIHLWRNVWKFVRSPTQRPLVSVEVATVHVVVVLRGDQSKNGLAPSAGREGGPNWGDLDTSTSLKRLDHPQWKQVGKWLRRLPFVCFLLPLVCISSSDISVDIVRDDGGGTKSAIRLQRGHVAIHAQYNVNDGLIDFALTVCPHEAAGLSVLDCGVEATVRDLRVKVSIPASRTAEDHRVPLPSSIFVSCEGIGCSIDMVTLMTGIKQNARCDPLQSQPSINSAGVRDTSAFAGAVLSSRGSLLLRLFELIPDVQVMICNIALSVTNGVDRFGCRIDAISCSLSDPSHSSRFGRRPGEISLAEEIAHERKLVVDLLRLMVSSEPTSSKHLAQSTSIGMDVMKVEVDSRLMEVAGEAHSGGHEHIHNEGVFLSWSTRCTAEARGLSVRLADDLAPWVSLICSNVSSPNDYSSTAEESSIEDEVNDTWTNFVETELQIQAKALRTEVVCQARKYPCDVLTSGVPDIGVFIEEVVLFAHPFLNDEPLGVRAKIDLQASRLKLFYAQAGRFVRTSFISIDFVRVFIEPICTLGSDRAPAEVEMEAEWLEVRWTPEAMHAIGGMLELGIVVLAPLLRENYDWTNDQHWDPLAPQRVPSMSPMSLVIEDAISPAETVKFRCKVKRSLVLFCHAHGGRGHTDYVTVDTLNMSVEETSGRFRLSILDTKICNVEGAEELPHSSLEPRIQRQHYVMRRRPSILSAHVDPSRETHSGPRRREPLVRVEGSPFFCVKAFALEENTITQCPLKVLDLFVEGVTCAWDMKTQERIVELIRRITFSSWEMLYRVRSAYGVHCTSPTSRYNRPGGRNGTTSNMSECEDAERLLFKLISAGGDALNRLHATNIDLTADFGDGKSNFNVQLHVGAFSSDDLPELWIFENVFITLDSSLKLLEVDRVAVRHTINRRRDYVFGFFEETLRLRKVACGKLPPNHPREDGMVIDIDGLRVGLSLQIDLAELASVIQAQVSPFVESHMRSFQSSWRPQNDIFYKIFLKIPNTPGQPRVWLQVTNIQVECADKPLEAWLERVYPLWMEELAEQELRCQLLDEQVNSLKLTSAEMLMSDEAANEMKSLLHEKSSKIYVHKVRRLQDNLRSESRCDPLHTGTIFSVRIGCVEVNVFSEPSELTITELIRKLDEATPSTDQVLHSVGLNPCEFGPMYAFLIHQRLDVAVIDASVSMRNFPTPVAVIEQVKVGGDVIVGALRSPDGAAPTFALTAAVRCFVDLGILIQRPVVFFGPAYIYGMLELAAITERVLPSLVLDVDRALDTTPWDIARRLLHGKLHLRVQEAAVRLFASSNTFEVGDYLEVGLQALDIQCCRGENAAADVTIERLTVKIEPDALVNIVEITSVTMHVEATWSARGTRLMHYLLPVEFCKNDRRSSGTSFVVVDLLGGTVWTEKSVDLKACLGAYSGTGFSVSLSGKIAPKNATELMTRRDIASRSAIVLYTKHVEWLIHFCQSYQPLSQVNYPSRRDRFEGSTKSPALQAPQASRTTERFLRVFQSITIDDFSIIGLDVALYHSEKSQVGIRACINDKVALSLSVISTQIDGESTKKCLQEPLRHVSVDLNGVPFVIDKVSLAVSDVQVRICTLATGSRGEALFSIRDVCLNVAGANSSFSRSQNPFDFSALHSELLDNSTVASSTDEERTRRLSSFRSVPISSSMSSQSVEAAAELSRTKSKMTILDHFAIAQHNPYRFRDDNGDAADGESRDRSKSDTEDRASSRNRIQATFVEDFRRKGFLLGLSASEIRVLVTLDTVETLVDIVENWVRVVRASLPELSRVPDAILTPPTAQEPSAPHATKIDSPKKATSLADDPKFGPIFHASNPLPNNRTPSFTVDIPAESIESQQSPGSNASTVEPFLIVRFMDCQINFQDHQNKGSVLLALSRGTVRHSRSQDIHHELVDIKVDGVQLFTAPLDIDVRSRVIWLRTLEDGFTYCPSSFGLLKQVVAPIPATVMIWIDQTITITNRVDLCIPTVQIGVNIDSKNILENLGMALTSVISAKLAEYQTPDYSKMLQGVRGSQNQLNVQSSLQQLLAAKQELKWKIAELQWRHACRWNYQITERASLAMQAVEGVRNHSSLEIDSLSSPFLPARRLSSVSLASSMGTSLSLTGSATTHVESASEELQRLQQQHESIGEVLRSLVAAELLKRQPNPNVQLAFTLQDASLTLSAANSDIVSATMTNLNVKLKMYEDQSGTFALTIQDVCCRNLCPNTPYPELLIPLSNSKSWSGDETFVRIDAEVAPPVGGIKVVRHFEINVHPMQVCLTYDLILQLVAFFTSISGPTQRQEEKKAEMRSQFLTVPQQTGSSSGEGLLRKAVKVAGKATHPLTHGLGRHRGDTDSDQPVDPRVKAMQALQEEATQWISRVARAEASKSGAGEDDGTPSNAAEKEINEMRDRANNNILFKRIRLGTVEVMVSFKNKKSGSGGAPQQALEDMRGFEVKIHSLVYSDKTCSLMDLLLRIRRDVILDVLSQVGRNFTNVATFLRDQLDITRWGAFDALAPLKSLSTAISGTSQSSLTTSAPASAANAAPATPGALSVEMLQRSPRISRAASSSSMAPTPVDTSKVFQLELPENHPSRRKKQPSQARPTEPVGKVGDAIAVPIAPLGSPKPDKDDGDAGSSTAGGTPGGKSRIKLSSLFGKSKRALPTADESAN